MKTKNKAAFQDPIVEEVRNVKQQLAKQFNYKVRAILKDAQSRQSHGRKRLIERKDQ